MLWVREHDPRQWEKTKKFLLPKDYIRFRLTGEYASEVSDASGTLLFDVTKRTWSKEMLDALDLDASLLPSVHESPEVSARVRADVAAELGLPAGTPVVGGGGDQAAGAVGNGVVRRGLVSSTIGSSGVVFAHSDAPALDPGGRVHTFCHAVPGAWHVMGVTQGAGLSLRWFRDEVAGPLEREAAAQRGTRRLRRPRGAGRGSARGLRRPLLPALPDGRAHAPSRRAGARRLVRPHRGPHARAPVRSVLEGVAYSLRDCLDLLVAMGVPVEEIRASGGGGRSPLWRQIQADVFGREVATINAAEGPAYGAALLAGVGTGRWKTVPEACAASIAVTSRVAPDAARQAVYARGHGVYREVYSRLRTLYPTL